MTEQVNVSSNESASQNQNNASTTTVTTQNSAPATPKLYTDEEVNRIVGEKKQKAYENGRQEALAELHKQNVNSSVAQPTVNSQSQNGLPPLTAEQEQKIADQVQQRLQNEQLVHQLALKMAAGAQKYSDFEKVVVPLQLQNIPRVTQLANGFDNTADILYDLGKNPSKVSSLMILANINPQLAHEELQRLSNSIKQNEQAKANQPEIREPLGQQNPPMLARIMA